MKTNDHISPERVRLEIQSRFNPIRGLTPENLSQRLDMFAKGFLRGFALTAQAIEERDDVIQAVAPKRKKAVARHGWEVLTIDDSPEAARHKEALEYFYNHVTVTNAIDLNVKGGAKLLVRQMMDAVGKRYAVHEIVWQPAKDGKLTAELRFVPLWFFENTLGRLRFLQSDYDLYGVDMEEGGWMVTCGDGIMVACAIAYMFKALPLKDWLIYCERFGMPGIKGTTSAARGSEEWNGMVEAVKAFGQDFAAVMSSGESIEPIDMKGTGQAPHPALVDRMDRVIATLWRGGDLSTISKGNQAVGSNAQAGESDMLDEDDSEMITETLQTQLDRWVIHYQFGDDVEPMAYFNLCSATQKATELDIKVDTFLIANGAPMGVADVMERYGRTMPDDDDELLSAPKPPTAPTTDGADGMGNEATTDHGPQDHEEAFARAVAADLQPLRKRLERILQIEDPEVLKAKLHAFKAELPQLLADINADPEGAKVLAGEMGAAMVRGITDGKDGMANGAAPDASLLRESPAQASETFRATKI